MICLCFEKMFERKKIMLSKDLSFLGLKFWRDVRKNGMKRMSFVFVLVARAQWFADTNSPLWTSLLRSGLFRLSGRVRNGERGIKGVGDGENWDLPVVPRAHPIF